MLKLTIHRALSCLLILSTLFSLGATVTARGFIGIAVNDQLIPFPDALPEINDDLTYVPVRMFSQAMGATVDWNEEKQQVTISKMGRSMIIDVTQKSLILETGKSQACPVYLKDDRVMAPYRQIASLFGYGVSYIPEGPLARAFIDLACKLSDQELLEKVSTELRAQQEEALLRDPPPPVMVTPPVKPISSKVAYLTFDDGPTASTGKILDILAEHEIKGTFFMLAGGIWNYQESVRRLVKDGHSAGLHGSTHLRQQFYSSSTSAVAEMDSCNAALETVAGVRSSLIRVPFGSKPSLTSEYRDALVKAGYRLWDWNVDTYDARSTSVPADRIITAVKEQTTKKEQAVILMHDRPSTIEALPAIIEFLKENDFAIEPLTAELIPVNFWDDRR